MITNFENHHPIIATTAYVDEAALVIGQVTLEGNVSIWPMSVVRGDVNTIYIGEGTNIQDGSVLHCTHDGPYTPGGAPLIIGKNNTVGHKVLLHACTIENNCLIGMSSTIMDKAVVGFNSIIAAGSLVPPDKILEGGFLWKGSPVKKVRPLSEEEKAMLVYSAEHYIRLAQKYIRTYEKPQSLC